MFISFVDALRRGGIPASLKEHLLLLEAMDAEVINLDPEQFYYLARSVFVHDESQLDRFDLIFGEVFKGIIANLGGPAQTIPEEWLRKVAEQYLSPEEMAKINAKIATLEREMESSHTDFSKLQRLGEVKACFCWIGRIPALA